MLATIKGRERVLGAAVLAGLLLGIGCAGSPSSDASAPPAADSGAPSSPDADPSCVAKPGPDKPDDEFVDSNCDGIDGDKSAAIFVAPSGADTAPGTLDAPVLTLAKAVALASAAKKDVYVCNGTYAEAVVIANASVGVYGGYDCENGWARNNDRASVAPGTGIPLTIRDATGVTLDRLALHAPDANDPSASSVGAFVATSQGITLTHVTVTAGRGADGATPSAPTSLSQTAMDGAPGRPLSAATCNRNDSNMPSVCRTYGAGGFAIAAPPACEGAGGSGGDGGNVLLGLANGTGLAGAPANVGGVAAGSNGSNGVSGADGTAATAGVGSVTASGYLASNAGGAGLDGTSGGGGAGGMGGVSRYSDNVSPYFNAGGGGGQGGNGGCGGFAGKGGGAGGASIGVLLFSSDVKLRNTSIRTANGGAGGRSVAGAHGQFGGIGGAGGLGTRSGVWPGNANPGGNGGNGGDGGNGGAGGGGPSLGILSNDRQPDLTAVTFNTSSGGKGGSGAGRTDGADGIARDTLVLNDSDAGAADAGSHD